MIFFGSQLDFSLIHPCCPNLLSLMTSKFSDFPGVNKPLQNEIKLSVKPRKICQVTLAARRRTRIRYLSPKYKPSCSQVPGFNQRKL